MSPKYGFFFALHLQEKAAWLHQGVCYTVVLTMYLLC